MLLCNTWRQRATPGGRSGGRGASRAAIARPPPVGREAHGNAGRSRATKGLNRLAAECDQLCKETRLETADA
jgi:hypothetical protein